MIFNGYTPESGLNTFMETVSVVLMLVGSIGQLVVNAAKTVAKNVVQNQKVEIAVDMEHYHQARKAEDRMKEDNLVDHYRKQIDILADFLLANFDHEFGKIPEGESATEMAVRLLKKSMTTKIPVRDGGDGNCGKVKTKKADNRKR